MYLSIGSWDIAFLNFNYSSLILECLYLYWISSIVFIEGKNNNNKKKIQRPKCDREEITCFGCGSDMSWELWRPS